MTTDGEHLSDGGSPLVRLWKFLAVVKASVRGGGRAHHDRCTTRHFRYLGSCLVTPEVLLSPAPCTWC